MAMRSRGQRGQAAVEAVLTLPLIVFTILGALQLFLLMQGRQMAQYAAFWAAREGSVTQGNCTDMARVTMKALLPTFTVLRSSGDVDRQASRRAFKAGYRYDTSSERGFSGDVFWLLRDRPLVSEVTRDEEERFDQGEGPMRLEVQVIFWYPLKIPFANWVMARMFLAHFGMRDYLDANPLLLTDGQSSWTDGGARFRSDAVASEFARRALAGEYVFPIRATSSMRMMTPAIPENFQTQDCFGAR